MIMPDLSELRRMLATTEDPAVTFLARAEQADLLLCAMPALLAVAAAAEEYCHVPTCPCCDGEWECRLEDGCTFQEDCPTEAEALQTERERLRPLRDALARLTP